MEKICYLNIDGLNLGGFAPIGLRPIGAYALYEPEAGGRVEAAARRGKCGNGLLGKFSLKRDSINEKIPLKINIPPFHCSMGGAKTSGPKNLF